MIITIDTHKDDVESIKKAISLLQSLAGGSIVSNSPEITQSAQNAFAGMFGDDAPMPTLSAVTQETAMPISIPEEPKIELY